MLSLPARTQAVLEFFFSSTGRSSFLPVDEAQAEAAIFDQDTLESRQRWLAFHARTGSPGIALSVQQQPVEGAVWVQKPVTPASLLAAAAQIHAGRAPVPTVAAGSLPSASAVPDSPPVAQHPADAAAAQLAQALAGLPTPVPVAAEGGGRDAARGVSPAADDPPASQIPRASSAPSRQPDAAAPVDAARRHVEHEAVSPRPSDRQPEVRSAVGELHPLAATTAESSPRRGGLGGLLRRFFGGTAAASPSASPRAPGGSSSAGLPTAPMPPRPAHSPQERGAATAPAAPPERSAEVAAAVDAGLIVPAVEAPLPSSVPVVPPMVVAPADPTVAASGVAAQPVRVPDQAGEPEPVEPGEPADSAPASQSQSEDPASTRVRLGGVLAAQAQANEARFCGLAADRSVQELAEDPELRYDPEVHLVSALREAYLVGSKWQVPTQLECSVGRIVVDTTRNLLLCDFDADRLESLFATPLGRRPKTRTLNRQEQAAIQTHTPHPQGQRRLDDLLWRAGLLTAVGRLPIEADPQRPIYLRHWPNLTRLTAIPHAVRIAAMWSARGASLVETAATLGIAQRHVIAFYNAASALDLLTEDGSHVRRAQRRVARNRGLLTRLLGWLHR